MKLSKQTYALFIPMGKEGDKGYIYILKQYALTNNKLKCLGWLNLLLKINVCKNNRLFICLFCYIWLIKLNKAYCDNVKNPFLIY